MPVIVPVELFKLNPPGNAPDVIEYETVLSDVALTVNDADEPAAIEPKEPADVDQVGASETVSKAVELLTAKPFGFSILIKYVPSVTKVALMVNCVAEFLVTVSANVITPVVDINSTFGVISKLVPVITI